VKKFRDAILEWHTEANNSDCQGDLADTIRHWQVKRCFNKEGQDQKFRLTYLLFGICTEDQKPMMMQTVMANLLRETPKVERKVGAPHLHQNWKGTIRPLSRSSWAAEQWEVC
jgi:hypothetical protein